jgi:putative Mn2+ efflux pump MntP
MPLIGYFLGISFADFVANVDHWIAFVLLGIIGSNMIKESFSKDECEYSPDFSAKAMFPLAVATSIDALAIGVSFAFLQVNIWKAILFIGLTTGAFSAVGVWIGKWFGCRYKSKAEFAGGFILVAMGVKILIEHTCC